MTRVILINGPARSGKSTAATAMKEYRGGAVVGFSYHLKRMVHCIYLGRSGALMDPECFDAVKGDPQAILGGMSWRQAYIHYSENVIKPLHGKEWFGERFLDAVRAQIVSTVYVPDSGFIEEAEAVVRALGDRNVTLIRVHRPGHDFAGDSRSYIALDHLGVKTFELHNDGTKTQYRDRVLDVLTQMGR